MFFPVSKILWFFATPSNLLITLSVIGVALLLLGWRRAGLAVSLVAITGLVIFAASPAPRLLMRALENHYPPVAMNDPGRVDGIIVLGGSAHLRRGQIKLNDAAARLTTAVTLARRYPEARVVFSGGDGRLIQLDRGAGEVDAVRLLLSQMGLEGDRVIFEDRSRNTRENASFTRELVTPKRGERWLLVTSAFHMPRSAGVFQHEGFYVTPYPVDYYTRNEATDFLPFHSFSSGLRLADLAVREWLGLTVYWLAGYTSTLLPDASAASGKSP